MLIILALFSKTLIQYSISNTKIPLVNLVRGSCQCALKLVFSVVFKNKQQNSIINFFLRDTFFATGVESDKIAYSYNIWKIKC